MFFLHKFKYENMKKIATLLVICLFSFSPIVEKKLTKTGTITFEASVPSFEEVKAKNEAVTCILNTDNGEIAALALMKGFRFKVALMEEHFNENYIESNKYPKATFKGKIEGFDVSKITTSPKEYNIKGKLEITCEINTCHGTQGCSRKLKYLPKWQKVAAKIWQIRR